MIDDNKLIRIIVTGNDWKEVLTDIIVEEEMDPKNLNIKILADSFVDYLKRMEKFDFRVPGRFILISAILLRMKCEIILDEEIKKRESKSDKPSEINLDDVTILSPPIVRRPTRKVTLPELITSLNKTFEFKKRKEEKKVMLYERVERLFNYEENIEKRIKDTFNMIRTKGDIMNFRYIIPEWSKKEIVKVLIPILHLVNRGDIDLIQEEVFGEITIKVLKDE